MTAPLMPTTLSDDLPPATIEWVLAQTRNGWSQDYRSWGISAAALLREFPELMAAVTIEAMVAKARHHMTREARRTADGIARVLADAETGQVTAWPDWTDPERVRAHGDRIEREGRQKVALGRRMKAVADAMDLAPGATARAAWVAIGGDPAALDEAEEGAA